MQAAQTLAPPRSFNNDDFLRPFANAPQVSRHTTYLDDPKLEKIFALRYQVYCIENSFLSAENFKAQLETDLYDARSVHFSSSNSDGDVLACARLITAQDQYSFPTLTNCDIDSSFNAPAAVLCGEVSRLMVSPILRRRNTDQINGLSLKPTETYTDAANDVRHYPFNVLLLLAVYRSIYQYCRFHRILYLYASMEPSLERNLRRLGFVFQPIGAESNYLGTVIPYILTLDHLHQNISKIDKRLATWICH